MAGSSSIDLKTGKSTAVTSDATGRAPAARRVPGGGRGRRLRRIRRPSPAARRWCSSAPGKEAKEQAQPAVHDGEEAGWARAMVRRTAETMAAATFSAVANAKCRVCPVSASCPVSGKGRQVVEPPIRQRRPSSQVPGHRSAQGR